MTTLALNRTAANNGNRTLAERFTAWKEDCKKSWKENSAEIICGLLSINGDTDACRVYQMLKSSK